MIDLLKAAARRVAYASPFAKWMHRYSEWRAAENADTPPSHDEHGVPSPDPFLITMVGGAIGWRYFLAGGEAALMTFASLVDKHGGDFRAAGRILDFGCGCGRLARHVPRASNAALFGVDYNGRLVQWCASNLKGDFSQNRLKPPLSFPDAHFDVIYLLSVFTHLRVPTQDLWLRELARVAAPGAFCLVTFHEEDHPNMGLTEITREQLLRDGTAIFNDMAEGSNAVSTFQSREFARAQFGRCFEVVEIVPSDKNPIQQAIAVLRKRRSGHVRPWRLEHPSGPGSPADRRRLLPP